MKQYLITLSKFFIVLSLLIASHDHLYCHKTSFQDKYVIQKEIGKGTYSTVYLCKDPQGKQFAVKKYALNNQELITIFEQNGLSISAFIEQLAENERDIGRLTDHPNIVKIREVILENSVAYVVMDYIEGEPPDWFETYPKETRLLFLRQLLSAIEHLLLRNVIIDDLWTGNMIVSHGAHLTLIDMGGNEIIHRDAAMPLEHYFKMIQNMVDIIGGDLGRKTLANCDHMLPIEIRNEIIASNHIKPLVGWIEAMQKELSTPVNLSNTIHEESSDKILDSFFRIQDQHPDHISFCTAQTSKFLPYSLVAVNVLKKFNPGAYTESYLQNTTFLRYPNAHSPCCLGELFQQFPVEGDYDTASSLVGEALISVSPSLNEKEGDESAWAIFEANDRKGDIIQYLQYIFEVEHVSPLHYREKIKNLARETPKSAQGIIYHFLIPKNDPIHTAVYLSEPYGIPKGDPHLPDGIVNFYQKYKQGEIANENPQLRFLPSALHPKNKFNLGQIKSYRFTTIPEEQLAKFARKVETVVEQIYHDHLEEMLQLAALAAETETLSDTTAQQQGYQKLCHQHAYRGDHRLALYYWHKLDDQNPHRGAYLTGVLACLLRNQYIDQAYHYFNEHEAIIKQKEQIIARFALQYLERGNVSMFELMLSKLDDSDLKKFLEVVADSKLPDSEYNPEYVPGLEDSFISDDELIRKALETVRLDIMDNAAHGL